jgi:hypothetical protein
MINKYNRFILESKFLKDVDILGYVGKKFYPGINMVLEKCDKDSYIQDDNIILWDYNKTDTTTKINEFTFRVETENNFNLEYLKFTREPIEIDTFSFNNFVTQRVNHYMIKSNNSDNFIFGELDYSDEIKSFVKKCYLQSNKLGLKTYDRYCYLTIDQKEIEPGTSQRDFGWHIDGMQGTEVIEKKPVDYQFIWADATPTKFCTQTFDISGVDISVHNIFNWLGKQVKEKLCYSLEKNKIYLMDAYHLHTATKADTKIYRKFVRLSFTNTPITSVKMTVNPDIKYNYKIHVSTGNIPSNLI